MVLLAFHYPPMLGPASERAASFARHLPGHGWHPTVVTVRRGLYHADAAHTPPPAHTLRTRSPEPSRLLAPLRRAPGDASSTVSEARGRPLTTGLRRAIRDWVYIPDGQAAWIPLAVKAAERALRAAPEPRVLLSTSVPFSAHLAARIVARREGVPWVAEFRDPWALVADALRPRSRGRKAVDNALERRVVEAANALVVTSDATREVMIAAHDRLSPDRVWVIRNGFDEVSDPATPPASDAPLLLLQAGSVPPDVPLEPLLTGIAEVARAHPGSVRLRVLAPPGRWEAAAAAAGVPEWLDLDGLVSPQEARQAMAGASANVLLRPGEDHREYVAAKLMEYLGARRPIMGVVAASGEMARLGREYGDMHLLPRYDVTAVSSAVAELLRSHRSGALQRAAEAQRPVEELSRRSQAAHLAACLRTLSTGG